MVYINQKTTKTTKTTKNSQLKTNNLCFSPGRSMFFGWTPRRHRGALPGRCRWLTLAAAARCGPCAAMASSQGMASSPTKSLLNSWLVPYKSL